MRLSFQSGALSRRVGRASSTSTVPCIWPHAQTAAMRSRAPSTAASRSRIAAATPLHQSSGRCSAQPNCGTICSCSRARDTAESRLRRRRARRAHCQCRRRSKDVRSRVTGPSPNVAQCFNESDAELDRQARGEIAPASASAETVFFIGSPPGLSLFEASLGRHWVALFCSINTDCDFRQGKHPWQNFACNVLLSKSVRHNYALTAISDESCFLISVPTADDLDKNVLKVQN